MLRVEPGNESRAFLCDHCHQMYGATRGFVYRDESAHALYYASLHDCGAGGAVYLAIGIGERGDEDGTFGDVRSVTFRVEPTETGVDMSVVDADDSPYGQARSLGVMMNRDAALAHEAFQELLHIADHIIIGDAIIGAYLSSFAAPPAAGHIN